MSWLTTRRTPIPAILLLALGLALAGCDLSTVGLSGRASDEWTRTYRLEPGGEVSIGNLNGAVDIEATEGDVVEVRAERIARATTDVGARELLARIAIRETATPGHLAIETQSIPGVLIGARFEVRYHVRAPASSAVKVETSNGSVSVNGIGGTVEIRTSNGRINGGGLGGAVDAQTTNGTIAVDLASVGGGRVGLSTVNGGIRLTVPDSAAADLSASWTNGGFDAADLAFDDVEQSRRRFAGRLNGGGTPIDLRTVNGGIRIRAASAATGAGRAGR